MSDHYDVYYDDEETAELVDELWAERDAQLEARREAELAELAEDAAAEGFYHQLDAALDHFQAHTLGRDLTPAEGDWIVARCEEEGVADVEQAFGQMASHGAWNTAGDGDEGRIQMMAAGLEAGTLERERSVEQLPPLYDATDPDERQRDLAEGIMDNREAEEEEAEWDAENA